MSKKTKTSLKLQKAHYNSSRAGLCARIGRRNMKRLFVPGLLALLPAYAQVVIFPSILPTGQVNTPYSQHLTASGGTAPYTFTLVSGSLPSGSPAFVQIGRASCRERV